MSVDTELDAAGARWRAGLGADPSLDELFAASQYTRRRALWPMLAAAALIVAVSLTTVVITRWNLSPSADRQGPTTFRESPCENDFSGTLTPAPPGIPAGRAQVAGLTLRYTGSAQCEVQLGLVEIDLVRQGAPDVNVYDTAGESGGLFLPAVLDPGDELAGMLTWYSYCGRGDVTALRMKFGNEAIGFLIPIGGVRTPACDHGRRSALYFTGALSASHAATLHVGIQYVGGPAPGDSPSLASGTVTLSLGSDPYRTVQVNAGERTSVIVAGIEDDMSGYRVTATSGDAQCIPQTISPAPGSESDLTVFCSVK